ncbi:MAG: FkbM family methyltransferase [Chitinophagales bacterium]|nr:FkbM family methyltransferase [Chitinophagales bacterium]
MTDITIQLHGITIHAAKSEESPEYFRQNWKDIESGAYEPETFEMFNRYVDNKTTFIDLGAYIGGTSLYCAQLAAEAFAFEPDPVVYKYLEQNLACNPQIKNLHIYNQAAGTEEGVVYIKSTASGGNAGSSIMINDFKSSWEVKLIDLAKFINENHKAEKLFLKIDIEGYEYELVKRLIPHIIQHKPTIFLAMHPQIIANSIKGNSIMNKLKRRLKMIKVHKELTAALAAFPHVTNRVNETVSLQYINNKIRSAGMLADEEKDLLVHF